jgi:hypothetical protein
MPVSVRGAAPQGPKPPAQALERPVVAKSVPPPATVGFAAKERALAVNPGKPIDPTALAAMRPVTPVAAPKVDVVAPTRSARPVEAPPSQAATANSRGKEEQRNQPQAMAPRTQPQPAPQALTPAQPVQRESTSPQRGIPQAPQESGGKTEGRNQPNAPAPVAAPLAVARPAEVNAPARVQAPEQRNKAEVPSQPNVSAPTPRAVPEQQRARPRK